jgi:hypothetical protein
MIYYINNTMEPVIDNFNNTDVNDNTNNSETKKKIEGVSKNYILKKEKCLLKI